MKTLQPPHWSRPSGYANGIVARGTQIFVACQIGWNAQGVFESDAFVLQTRQALSNALDVLREAGASPHRIARMNRRVPNKKESLARPKEVGAAYRDLMCTDSTAHCPATTAIEVCAVMERSALVAIEYTAALPKRPNE